MLRSIRPCARYADWAFSEAPNFVELFDLTRDPDQIVNLFGSRNLDPAALDTGRGGYGADDALVSSLASELRRQFVCQGASCRAGDGDLLSQNDFVDSVNSELTAALVEASRKYFDRHQDELCDAGRFPVYGYSKLGGVVVNQALSGALALLVLLALGCYCAAQACCRKHPASPPLLQRMCGFKQ